MTEFPPPFLPPSASKNNNMTALHWASGNGYLEVIEALLAAGAIVDAKNDVGDEGDRVMMRRGMKDELCRE